MCQPTLSSIIICSIVRDAEKGLHNNIPIIEKLVSNFKSWKIVIYENDSVDQTKTILKRWGKKFPDNIFIISENNHAPIPTPNENNSGINPFFSRKRISKMAKLRNRYLDFIEDNNFYADYLMIVDLDVARIDYSGLLDSFTRKENWDAITAFGYSTSPHLKRRYHDTYALCEKNKADIPQTEIMIQSLADEYALKCKDSSGLIPVDSAFGGAAIYRFNAIKGLRYEVVENRDDRVEVRCEHYSFNRQMASRGYDKIYINPKMKLKYQVLNLSFIINKIKKKFIN